MAVLSRGNDDFAPLHRLKIVVYCSKALNYGKLEVFSMMLETQRQEICHIGRVLFAKNMVQYNGGNVSLRDPESNLVAIKPSGMAWEKMEPKDVVVVDMDGNVVEAGWGKPSIETAMHLQLYKNRPDFNAVIHCHAPHAIAWSAKGHSILRAMTPCFCFTRGAVKVAPYAPAGDPMLAKYTADTIGQTETACILRSHGIVCCGKDMDAAMVVTLTLEDGAKIACLTTNMPGETIYLDKELGEEMGIDTMSKINFVHTY